MDWKHESIERNAAIKAFCEKHAISIKSDFVPFSQSRNAPKTRNVDPSKRSLNWRVTFQVRARDVFTTDYSAGIAHCPSYKQGARWTMDYSDLIIFETEQGHTARRMAGISWTSKGKPIHPDPLDVLHSLLSDSDVLEHATFEDWAAELGYDTDSRNAESIYRACLSIALQFRAAIGEEVMRELRELFQDY